MTKGKPWTVEEEKHLKELVIAKISANVIAKQMGKTYEATMMKCEQLKSEVVINDKSQTITTLAVQKELPTIEDAHIAVKELPKDLPLNG